MQIIQTNDTQRLSLQHSEEVITTDCVLIDAKYCLRALIGSGMYINH